MGFISKLHRKEREIEKERIKAYLNAINEVNQRHKLILVPIIGKYSASFEVQEMPEETKEIPKEDVEQK